MSQKPPSDPRSTQPAAPNTTPAETQSSVPIILDAQVRTQESPLAISTLRGSSQEPSHNVGILKASSQEPPQFTSTRRVSIQEPPAFTSARLVSIPELPASTSAQSVDIPELPESTSAPRVSSQEPPQSAGILKVSSPEPSPVISTRRVSVQDPLSVLHSRRVSIQEPSPDSSTRRPSIQDTPSITYNRWVGARESQPTYHNHHRSTGATESKAVTSSSQTNTENLQTTATPYQIFKQNRLSVDVPPSITHSPQASIQSIESIVWDSQESYKNLGHSFQASQTTIDNIQNYLSRHSNGMSSARSQDKRSRQSLLPIGWRLLHEARKISRQLSLVLTLAGMVIISLISLGQPWMHFQVPLMPPGDADGSLTIPIDTIFFMQCPDVVCMYEYDQNAYLLDLSWAFLVIASITSFCLCVALISILFFTSSNLPMLDFFLFISSIMTGTSIILGILFYLMQAHKFLQEGMTYSLGISFYLAWTGVFLFLMTGLFSYLNYVNFWSILAIQAIWV